VRVLVASDHWFPNETGGAARFAADLAERLADAGHQIDALLPARSRTGADVRLAGTLPRGRMPRTVTDTLAALLFRLRRRSYDVAIAHQVTLAAGLAGGAPLVFAFHASSPREARLRGAPPGFGFLLAGFERRTTRRAAAIVCLSEYSRELIDRDHPDAAPRVHVIPGAIDTDHFRPATPDRLSAHVELLIVRRLERGLGIDEALEAVALLVAEQPLRVTFAGAGPGESTFRAKAESLGLGELVSFTGSLSQADLLATYRRAHATLIPPAPHEGFGLAPLESLACGRPAVGAGGALRQTLGALHPALVADDSSPSALAKAARAALQLAADADFRRSCRSYVVENFGWPSVTARWETLLSSVADRA